jgi:hypothetical protein
MGRGYVDLTPEQRAAAAERARSLKRFGEKHGLTRIAENLKKRREAETAPPREPTPQRRKRKPGGGRHPKLKPEQQTWLQQKFSRDLKANPLLKNGKVAVPHGQKLARTKFKIEVGSNTLLGKVIRPVLHAAKNNQK